MINWKYFLLFAILFSTFFKCKSQGLDAAWYFGNNAGITFTSGVPTVVTNSAATGFDIFASALDTLGNLLFYSNGEQVWNSNHAIMTGGINIGGNTTAGNAAVIVPKPGSPNIFYIFTPTSSGGNLQYSTVDMSLSGGLGSVISSAIFLSNNLSEKLFVVGNCSLGTYWLITRVTASNQYKVFPVTSAGIGLPVISNAGSNLNSPFGQIEYCKTTSKIAIAAYDDQIYEVLDFDQNTGLLSNPITLPNHFRAWGVAFSPDGTKLYNTSWTLNEVRQFNLNAGSAAAINASNVLVGTVTGTDPTYKAGYLQLGPDNRVYITKFGANFVSTINNPNALGAACNFVNNSLSLNGKICQAGFCQSISPIVSESINFTTTNTCAGSATQFVSPPNLTSYTWNFNDPASGASNASTLQSPSHIFTVAGTYNVELIGIGACVNDTITNQIIISPSTQTIAPSDTITCANDSILVVASGGTIYQWNNGITSANDSIYVQVSSTTQFIVTALNGTCASIPDTFNVSVSPLSSAVINGSTTMCQGDSLLLIASGNSINYQWTGLSNSTNDTLAIAPNNSGNVYLQGTGACNNPTDSVYVNVFAVPSVNFTNTGPFCNNTNVPFTYTGNSVLNYSWNFDDPASGVNNTSILQNPTHNFLVSGTYNVTLIGSNNCGNDTTTLQIIIAIPPVTVGPADTIICANDTVLMVASGGTTYQWNNGITSTNDSVYISIANTSQFIVTAINSGCPILPDTFNITISPSATAQITGPSTLCVGDSITLIAAGNSANYQWSGLSNSTNDTIVIHPSAGGMMYLQGISNICNSAIDSISISLTASPIASFNAPGPFCNNANIAFNFTGNSASTFVWNFGDPNSGNLNTSAQQSPSHSFNQAGNYNVTLIINNSCGADTVNQNIIIASGPIVNLPNDTTLCVGQTITLNANAGVIYNWMGDTISNSNSITVSPTQNSIYLLNVSNGVCFGPIDTIIISVIQPNVVHIVGENFYCVGDTVVLYGQGATNFSWNAFGNNYLGTSIELISPTSGYVFASAANAVCPGIADTFFVSMAPQVKANFSYHVDTCSGKILFNNHSVGSPLYHWNFGNGNESNEANPQFNITESGSYFITLITNPGSNCADTISTDFYLDEAFDNNYFIPNTFTPNDDDLNQQFKITTANRCKYFIMEIYNRWGNKILTTEGYEVIWDGKYKGYDAPTGVYVYLLNDGTKDMAGTVTLFR